MRWSPAPRGGVELSQDCLHGQGRHPDGQIPRGQQPVAPQVRQVGLVDQCLGVRGPQGLGGDSTAFAVHVELAATHITMNPVAVNMQCHSARRATATFTPGGVSFGF